MDLTRVVSAVETIYSPLSSNSSRQEAQKFLDSLKESAQAALYGFSLLSSSSSGATSSQTQQIQFLGLTLIEHCVKYRWTQYSVDEQNEIITRLAQVVDHLQPNNTLMASKLSLLLSLIAKKTFFRGWTTLPATLRKWITAASGLQKFVAVSLVKTLMQDIVLEDPQAVLRKEELSTSLQIMCGPEDAVRKWLFKSKDVEDVDPRLVIHPAGFIGLLTLELTTGVNASSTRPENAKLVKEILETLTILLGWLVAESIESSNVLPVLIGMPSVPQYASDTEIARCIIDCYSSLLTRNWTEDAFNRIITPNLPNIIENLINLYRHYNKSSVDADAFHVLKTLAMCVDDAGHAIFKHNIKSAISPIWSLVMDLCAHPSNALSTSVVGTASELLKIESITQISAVTSTLPTLLDIALTKHQKSEGLSPSSNYFFELEFLTQSEKDQILELEKIKWTHLVKAIALAAPLEILTYVSNNIVTLFNIYLEARQTGAKPTNDPRLSMTFIEAAGGIALVDSSAPFLHTFRASTQQLEQVVVAISSLKSSQRPDMTGALSNLTNLIFNTPNLTLTSIPDPNILSRYLICLVETRSVWAKDETVFGTVVAGLIETSAWTTSLDQVSRELVIGVRGKSLKILRTLVSEYGAQMDALFPAISNRCEELCTSSNVDSGSSSLLIEFLVELIVKSRRDQSWKFSTAERYLSRPLTVVSETDFANVHEWTGVAAVATIIKQLRNTQGGLNEEMNAQLNEQLNRVRTRRRQLEEMIHLLDGCFKKTVNTKFRTKAHGTSSSPTTPTTPTTPMLEAVHVDSGTQLMDFLVQKLLPQIMNMMASLNSLFDPAQLPVELHPLLSVTKMEKLVLLGQIAGEVIDKSHKFDQDIVEKLLEEVRGFVTRMREHGISLVICFMHLPSTFTFPPEIVLQLFGHARHLQMRHWARMLTPLRHIFTCCPSNRYPDLLGLLVPNICQLLRPMIMEGWEKVVWKQHASGEDDSEGETSNDVISDEMVQEVVLRNVSNTWSDLWRFVFSKAEMEEEKSHPLNVELRKGGKTDFAYPELVIWILTNKETAESALLSLVESFSYKDNLACNRALSAFKQIIPHLAESEEIRPFLATTVLKNVLQALNNPWHITLYRDMVYLVMTLYRTTRPHATLVLETLQLLPNMTQEKLTHLETRFATATNEKSRLALWMEFLDDIKGVSLSEQFKSTQSLVEGSKSLDMLRKKEQSKDHLGRTQDDDDKDDVLINGSWLFD